MLSNIAFYGFKSVHWYIKPILYYVKDGGTHHDMIFCKKSAYFLKIVISFPILLSHKENLGLNKLKLVTDGSLSNKSGYCNITKKNCKM